MPRIALFGAAGAIGKSIANALHHQNTPYRVVGRSHAPLQQTFGNDALAEITLWNPDDPASVRAAAEDYVFVGELALDGMVRPVRGALPIAVAVRQKKIKNLIVPEANAREAAVVAGVNVYLPSLQAAIGEVLSKV